MSSDSDTDSSYGSFSDSSCEWEPLPKAATRQAPPLRRLVDIAEPSSQPAYNFTVLYNERVPTGARIEIEPNQQRRPFKPHAPLPPGDRDQGDTMWGDAFSTHFRTEMHGIDRSKHNGNYTGLDRFAAAPYPFASEDGFNTKDQYLGGIGPLPHYGSHVKQGMGDVSQQILERYTGAKGFKQPKREVEKSHPRNRQLPIKTPNFEDWQQRAAMALPDKKPFELPFMTSRDTGVRTMPFGNEPLQPELRIMPTDHLRHSEPLPTRVNNIPTQAQANPNGQWMQGTQPFPEMREPMFDYSDAVRTPAPVPNTAYQPPLMQAPVRITPTNRDDTAFEWRGPAGNSSASARMLDPNFDYMTGRVAVEETPWAGPAGNSSAAAGGHVATVVEALPTQRDGNSWYSQPGPAFGGGMTTLPYSDQARPTGKQFTEQTAMLPRIVRSDIGTAPLPFEAQRATLRQSMESSVIMAPMQNTGPAAGPTPVQDFRTTLKQGLESVSNPPRMQLPQGGAIQMPFIQDLRSTTKQSTVEATQQGRIGGQAVGSVGQLAPLDQARPTVKQTTVEATQQGRIGGEASNKAGPTPLSDVARMTGREGLSEQVFAANIAGAAAGKAPIRHFDDEFRETRREYSAENPALGAPHNSSAAAGGYTSTGVDMKCTERNRDGMELTYSFGPVDAQTKGPTDRSYLANLTWDDRKEISLYNRIPGPSRFNNVPRNMSGTFDLPPDDVNDFTRTGNPNLAPGNQRRMRPAVRYSETKDLPQVFENRYIEPYQTSQLRTNPYATDVRVISGQPNY